jgi:hypothetical protein
MRVGDYWGGEKVKMPITGIVGFLFLEFGNYYLFSVLGFSQATDATEEELEVAESNRILRNIFLDRGQVGF